jgi:putative DNA primase/helicase
MASYPDQPKKLSRTKQARGPQVARDAQNSVTPGSTSADRSRKARSEAAAQDENTVRARRARSRSQSTEDLGPKSPTERPGAPDTDSRAVPDHINARYIKVGNKYHFTNGDLAFADRGRGLSTRLENTEVIRDLIAIAKERGWNDIALGGTERFRKEAWQQANLAGLTVRGYRPSELERAQLVRLIGR